MYEVPVSKRPEQVFSKNKMGGGFLKSGAELMQEVEKFKRYTRSIGGEFESYDRYGTWIFKVSFAAVLDASMRFVL